jgi:hypothetical protein
VTFQTWFYQGEFMHRLLCKTVLASFCIVGGCSATSEKNEVNFAVQNDTLTYVGRLSEKAVEALNAEFIKNEKIKHFILTSEGGHGPSVLKLAKTIKENKISLIVKDYCISSCASIIFISADYKLILKNSFVAFHTTLNGNYDVVKRSKIFPEVNIDQSMLAEERGLYEDRRVSNKIIKYSDDILEPICVSFRDSKQEKSTKNIRIDWNYEIWSVQRNYLSELGIQNVRGDWPRDAADLERRFFIHFQREIKLKWVQRFDEVDQKSAPIPLCPA